MTFEIYGSDGSNTCKLYSEADTITFNTPGDFSVQLGANIGNFVHSSYTLKDLFNTNNSAIIGASGSVAGMATTCPGLSFNGTSSSASWFVNVIVNGTSMGAVTISSVPFASTAANAENLQGLTANNFLQVNTNSPASLSQFNVENIFSTTNYPILTNLLAGTSSLYKKDAANGTTPLPMTTNPTSPTAGEIWYDSGLIKYYNGTATQTLGIAGAGVTSVFAGTGLNVGAGPGGTITNSGTLNINVGTGVNQIVQLDSAAKLPAVNGSQLTYLNGSAITSGTIGGGTAILTSGNIQTSGSFSGTKTYLYDHAGSGPGFVAMQSPTNTGAGYTLTFPTTAGSSGQFLYTDGFGVLSWANPVPTGAAGGDLSATYPSPTVAKIQGTAVSTTIPTASGQVLRYNGSAWAPNFIAITDLRSSITGSNQLANSCTSNQTLTYNSVGDLMSCQDIAITDSQVTATLTRAANTFFAAPDSSAGVGTFRTIVSKDLPFPMSLVGSISTANGAEYDGFISNLTYGAGTTSANTIIANRGVFTQITNQAISQAIGVSGEIGTSTSNSNSISLGIGVRGMASVQNGSNITTAVGLEGSLSTSSSGTITNGYGALIKSPSGANFTQIYGVYVEPQAPAAPQAYAFYQAGPSDINYFAGKVGIGTTALPGILSIYATSANSGSWSNQLVVQSSQGGTAGASITLDSTPYSVANHSWSIISNTVSNIGGGGALQIWDNSAGATRMIISTIGNVGIGTVSPNTTLSVNGAISNAASISNSTSTIDFAKGNLQYTSSYCATFYLWNIKDGGTYTFVVQGSSATTCLFNAYSDAGATLLPLRTTTGFGTSIASKHTLFTFKAIGGNVYAEMTNGL